MKIVFVHTPMAAYPVPDRREFWQNFDIQYHATHPGLRHMNKVLWELPHWMHWLGGVLVEHDYTDISALDFYSSETALSGIDESFVRAALYENPADVYLFSPMTPNLCYAYEIADVIKDISPKSVNVFGGVVATPLHKQVAQYRSVDYVVFDRGEFALPDLLKAIEGKQDISQVGQLSYRTLTGEVVTNLKTYPWPDVNNIPFPKIDLFPAEMGGDLRYLRQVYALGCPYKCPFCTIQTIGRKADYFHIDRVISEIKAYRAHFGEHHNIYWGDETFTVNKSRTLAICEALEREGDIFYDIQTRLNCLTDNKVLTALKRSGCRWVEIGLETVNQESQNIFKQRTKLSEIEKILKQVRDAGLPTCSFVVNGFPNQTIDDMRRSIDYICELLSKNLLTASYLFGLVPYPGSTMYEKPEDFGLSLLHHDFKFYHEEMPPVFKTTHAGPEAIHKVFLEGVRQLGQAMDKPSYWSKPISKEEKQNYGQFWASAHV